jgi:tetratricopeptide (TPR) repeat protein
MYKISLLLVSILAITNLGHVNLESHIDSLKVQAEKTPDDYFLHFDLGICYYSLQEYDSAFAELVKALSLKEDHMPTIGRLILVYGHLGEYERMLEFCNTSMRKFGKPDYFLSYGSGIANALLGNCDSAIGYYNDALALPPYCGNEYEKELELAMIHHSLGDTIAANELFNESVKRVRIFGRSWEAICYFRFGRYAEAARIQNGVGKDYIDMYNLGVYQIASGDRMGLVTIKSACGKDTTGFVKAVYDAITNIISDSLSEVEETLKQKIPYVGTSGMANGLLAWTLERLGKADEAKKYWFNCYGKLPLAIDVESMRHFINYFLSVIR